MSLEAEFEALFRIYQQPITAYLINLLGDAERGEELAQETFLRAYRALASGTRVEYTRAWLYRIATNAANDHFRRARLVKWLPLHRAENHAALRIPDPAECIAEQLVVRAALAQLRPHDRILLMLHLCEGLSTAEMAEVLGISRSAVKMRLMRTREQFRHAFRAVSGAESEEG